MRMMYGYQMPTQLIIGAGCIEKTKEQLKNYGTQAYIITGKHASKKNGSLEDVKKALESQKINYHLFDEVEANPSLETLQKAVDQVKNEKIDFIIGIGGGSPIDAAKGIAVLLASPNLCSTTLIGGEAKGHLPVVAVPTTAGTGTEVTQYAIVTDHKDKTKKNIGHRVFPSLAYLDATYMMGMAHELTQSTAVDAMSHLVESYLNKKSNSLSEAYVQQGLQLFGECIASLLDGRYTYEIREKLLLASTLGGMAIAQTGTSLPHGMGYSLTYHKGVLHGLANGVLYNAYLDCFKDQTKVDKIVQWMGLESREHLRGLLQKLCPSEGITLTEEELERYSLDIYSNKAKTSNHPEEVTKEMLEAIYRKSLKII